MEPQHYHAPPGAENAALLEAMAEDAAGIDPDARKHVYQAFLDSTLLFFVDSLPDGVPNGGLISSTSDLVFPFGKKETGETYSTAFTGEKSLRASFDPNSRQHPIVRIDSQENLVLGQRNYCSYRGLTALVALGSTKFRSHQLELDLLQGSTAMP
jgi:hypothetical protein